MNLPNPAGLGRRFSLHLDRQDHASCVNKKICPVYNGEPRAVPDDLRLDASSLKNIEKESRSVILGRKRKTKSSTVEDALAEVADD
ncbi:hypothetical protein H112_04063, partial [Trichophyton rubrum D6]